MDTTRFSTRDELAKSKNPRIEVLTELVIRDLEETIERLRNFKILAREHKLRDYKGKLVVPWDLVNGNPVFCANTCFPQASNLERLEDAVQDAFNVRK